MLLLLPFRLSQRVQVQLKRSNSIFRSLPPVLPETKDGILRNSKLLPFPLHFATDSILQEQHPSGSQLDFSFKLNGIASKETHSKTVRNTNPTPSSLQVMNHSPFNNDWVLPVELSAAEELQEQVSRSVFASTPTNSGAAVARHTAARTRSVATQPFRRFNE
jgi:hypothetical protein